MQTFTDLTLPAPFQKIHTGKVRDTFTHPSHPEWRILVTTDRQSAFDVNLGAIPRKGQVLNEIAAWWFTKTASFCPNHLVAKIDPNVVVVKNAKMFPVEVIVRGYMTGSTGTSIWVNYQKGVREFCGNHLEEGMVKNQKLPKTIITPTTKPETGHDELTSRAEIIKKGWVSEAHWNEIEEKALALFAEGQKIAAANGLILVDTKYEFGLDSEGNVIVCDEVHTPDSSRYWIAATYEERLAQGEEPQSLDKEFLRLWLRQNGYVDDGAVPEIPDSVRIEMGDRYINMYEKVTGERFIAASDSEPIADRIVRNVVKFFG